MRMRQVEPAILAAPVEGMNLSPGTLRDQLAAPATLVAFLRHLHCMFCREMVDDLRAAAADAAFPPVVLVTQSPKEDLADFFAERWPAARAIADPARGLYSAFDVARASFGGLMGPAVWSCGVRASRRGHTQKLMHTIHPPTGDPWLLSALFLIEPGGIVRWECRAKYAGDRPDYDGVPRGLPAPSPGMAGRGLG